jgi:predicted component of type VI protein secretion system
MKNRYLLACVLIGILAGLLTGCSTGDGKLLPTNPSDTPVISFSISPTSGPAGTIVSLTWTVTPANTRVTIAASSGVNPGTGFATTGATTQTPTVTTIYTLTGTDPNTGAQTNATQTFTVK